MRSVATRAFPSISISLMIAPSDSSAMVFGIDAADPATLLAAAVLLGGIAMLASCIPAVRASRADVTSALRSD